MFSKSQLLVMATGAAVLGCDLSDKHKDSCSVQGDCLDGFSCVNHVCSTPGSGPGGGPDGVPDGGAMDPNLPGDAATDQFGVVEPFAAQTTGLVAGDNTLLGSSAVAGNLGCALVGSETASPGGPAAVVYVNVRHGATSDRRCPDGTYSILNDAVACSNVFGGRLAQCGIYKQWDASGALIAQRLAIGGFVTVQDLDHGGSAHTCSVELSLAFDGGGSIQSSYSFDYNSFGTSETFCVH
jgi:hypothetical protein